MRFGNPTPLTVHANLRRLAASILIVASASIPATAGAQEEKGRDVKELAGEWIVDLRPTVDAPEFLKRMQLEVGSDNAVRGTFYDSPIAKGRADASKERTCFAFTTSDGSGAYQTAGCLVGDKIEGQTWSEGRGFLLTWTATRQAR